MYDKEESPAQTVVSDETTTTFEQDPWEQKHRKEDDNTPDLVPSTIGDDCAGYFWKMAS